MDLKGNTLIESIGTYLPKESLSTDEILLGCKKKIKFPLERVTGIKSRRVGGIKEFSIDLARNAILDCMEKSKY
jgi:3-oxoacyl-[acyl-carrier-protein] synthase III